MEYSNEYAQDFSDKNFGKVRGVRNLYADGRVPNGYTKVGDLVYNIDGKQCLGTTKYRGKGLSDVYLYKAAFVANEQLYLTMGHEYMHALYNSYNLFNDKLQHKVIYQWEYDQAVAFSYNVSKYEANLSFIKLPKTSKYNINTFPIIKLIK